MRPSHKLQLYLERSHYVYLDKSIRISIDLTYHQYKP